MLLLMMTLLYLSPSLFFKEHFKNLILNFFLFFILFLLKDRVYMQEQVVVLLCSNLTGFTHNTHDLISSVLKYKFVTFVIPNSYRVIPNFAA